MGMRPIITMLQNQIGVRPFGNNDLKLKFGSKYCTNMLHVTIELKNIQTLSISVPKDPIENKRKAFDECVKRYTPVLGNWFQITFTDAYSW